MLGLLVHCLFEDRANGALLAETEGLRDAPEQLAVFRSQFEDFTQRIGYASKQPSFVMVERPRFKNVEQRESGENPPHALMPCEERP